MGLNLFCVLKLFATRSKVVGTIISLDGFRLRSISHPVTG